MKHPSRYVQLCGALLPMIQPPVSYRPFVARCGNCAIETLWCAPPPAEGSSCLRTMCSNPSCPPSKLEIDPKRSSPLAKRTWHVGASVTALRVGEADQINVRRLEMDRAPRLRVCPGQPVLQVHPLQLPVQARPVHKFQHAPARLGLRQRPGRRLRLARPRHAQANRQSGQRAIISHKSAGSDNSGPATTTSRPCQTSRQIVRPNSRPRFASSRKNRMFSRFQLCHNSGEPWKYACDT